MCLNWNGIGPLQPYVNRARTVYIHVYKVGTIPKTKLIDFTSVVSSSITAQAMGPLLLIWINFNNPSMNK